MKGGAFSSTDLILGVDVGGSKVAVLVVDVQGNEVGKVVHPTRLQTPVDTLDGIVEAVYAALQSAGGSLEQVSAIGFGIPGRVNLDSGVVQTAVNLNWTEVPAGSALSARLGVPCFLEYDVRMATLGVYRHARYARVQNLAYVSIGTGIAAGLILEGRLYRGAHGMAGEIGHVIVQPGGPRCTCGAYGCLEVFAAGPAIARRARQVYSKQKINASAAGTFSAVDVFQSAEAGDAQARAIVDEVGRYLGQTLRQIVLSYDVELVVLGGGVARAGEAFLAPVLRELRRQQQDSLLARQMLPPEKFQLLPDGFDAALWGGVALAEQGLAPENIAKSRDKLPADLAQ